MPRLDSVSFVLQSACMDNNWAAENLHLIRTLMERSALYRRALAPIMLYLGTLGILASLAGEFLRIEGPGAFVLFWSVVGVAGLGGAFLLARRQAIKDAEPFWSPPTRHVGQALLPPLLVGAVAGVLPMLAPRLSAVSILAPQLPAVWMALYGCALTSAGFFMRRGIRVLGWIFLGTGCFLLAAGFLANGVFEFERRYAHLAMGATFGVLHLLCGVYLQFGKDSTHTL